MQHKLNKLFLALGIRITRLAWGVPFGTELEYADDVTPNPSH